MSPFYRLIDDLIALREQRERPQPAPARPQRERPQRERPTRPLVKAFPQPAPSWETLAKAVDRIGASIQHRTQQQQQDAIASAIHRMQAQARAGRLDVNTAARLDALTGRALALGVQLCNR